MSTSPPTACSISRHSRVVEESCQLGEVGMVKASEVI